jgi:magnesium-transporting ATPase (P-type)
MYFGTLMFFEDSYNLITEDLRHPKSKLPTKKMKMDTMIFHTTVLMTLFNQINCRVIDPSEKNVFKTLFNNVYFWLIFAFEMIIQNYIVHVPEESTLSKILGMCPLSLT